jgi:hypothetical protein
LLFAALVLAVDASRVASAFSILLVEAAAALAVPVLFLALQRRRSTLVIENDRLRLEGRGPPIDIALDDVLEFVAELPSSAREPRNPRGDYRLLVLRAKSEALAVPLFVKDAAEAQFIADRANSALAARGRDTSAGYRGEHTRVEVDEPHVRVDAGEEAALPTSEAEDQRRGEG